MSEAGRESSSAVAAAACSPSCSPSVPQAQQLLRGEAQAPHGACAQLEETVMFLMDPRHKADFAATAQAHAFESRVRQSWDGLRLSLQTLAQSEKGQVKFWCLQSVLGAAEGGLYASLEPAQRGEVKRALGSWIGSSSERAEVYVRNKFAQVAVHLFLTGDWSTFFTDILACLPMGHRKPALVCLLPAEAASEFQLIN
jgi:hypothetical protein